MSEKKECPAMAEPHRERVNELKSQNLDMTFTKHTSIICSTSKKMCCENLPIFKSDLEPENSCLTHVCHTTLFCKLNRLYLYLEYNLTCAKFIPYERNEYPKKQ